MKAHSITLLKCACLIPIIIGSDVSAALAASLTDKTGTA